METKSKEEMYERIAELTKSYPGNICEGCKKLLIEVAFEVVEKLEEEESTLQRLLTSRHEIAFFAAFLGACKAMDFYNDYEHDHEIGENP